MTAKAIRPVPRPPVRPAPPTQTMGQLWRSLVDARRALGITDSVTDETRGVLYLNAPISGRQVRRIVITRRAGGYLVVDETVTTYPWGVRRGRQLAAGAEELGAVLLGLCATLRAA
jgi:hypothetical protein